MTYSISAEGLALIQHHEGFIAAPAPLGDGNWVVGYGHVRAGAPGEALTREAAADLLVMDIAPIERLVNAQVNAPLTQSQFDALVSFVVSIGAEAFVRSQVLRRINTGEHAAAACAMEAWRKRERAGAPEICEALIHRRAAEKALYLRDAPHAPMASAFGRATLDYAASVLGAPAGYDAAPAPQMPAPAEAAQSPAARLTEILASEPATQVLLLTEPANESAPDDDAGEIVTAHAKPAARTREADAQALPIDRRIKHARAGAPRFSLTRFVTARFAFLRGRREGAAA